MTDIQKLYERIPTFLCNEGCTDCCDNQVQFAEEELMRIPKVEWNDSLCPYLRDNKCSVYACRGFICRIYGASELFPCPHGCGPETLLPESETLALFREYVRIKTEQERLSKTK